jgi:hypothetical protein
MNRHGKSTDCQQAEKPGAAEGILPFDGKMREPRIKKARRMNAAGFKNAIPGI